LRKLRILYSNHSLFRACRLLVFRYILLGRKSSIISSEYTFYGLLLGERFSKNLFFPCLRLWDETGGLRLSPSCFLVLLPSSATTNEVSRVTKGSEKCFDISYSEITSIRNTFLKENVYLSELSFDVFQSLWNNGGS